MMYEPMDAEDICMNCGRPILAYKDVRCPWCGEVWDEYVCNKTKPVKNGKRKDFDTDRKRIRYK